MSIDVLDSFDNTDEEIKRIKKNARIDDKVKTRIEKTYTKGKSKDVERKVLLENKKAEKQAAKEIKAIERKTFGEIIADGVDTYLRLFDASKFNTALFTILIIGLIPVHTYGVSRITLKTMDLTSMGVLALVSTYAIVYFISFVLASFFELGMVSLELDNKHKESKRVMFMAMLVLIGVAGMEYRFNKANFLDFITMLRLVGGIALIPMIRYLVSASKSALKEGKKDFFKEMGESDQKGLLAHISMIQKLKKKKGGGAKKWRIQDISNSFNVTKASLKKVLTREGIFTKDFFYDHPDNLEKNFDPEFLKQLFEHVDHWYSIDKTKCKVEFLMSTFSKWKLKKGDFKSLLSNYREDMYKNLYPQSRKAKEQKTEKGAKGFFKGIFG